MSQPRPPQTHQPVGYVTALRGDLAEDLSDVPTKRRHPLPPDRWLEPDTAMIARILDGLDRI